MKKVLFLIGFAALFAVLFIGCSANKIDHPYAKPPASINVDSLNRTQYEVLEKTQGAGKTSLIGLWPLPLWWTYSDDGTFWMWGLHLTSKSTNIARNRAVQIVPRADDLFDPIVEHKKFNAIWYMSVATTVKGKAIVVKTEDECKQAGSQCWQSIMVPTVRNLGN